MTHCTDLRDKASVVCQKKNIQQQGDGVENLGTDETKQGGKFVLEYWKGNF